MNRHNYTEEEDKWLRDNVKGVGKEELTKRFNEHFKTNLTPSQIANRKATLKITADLVHKYTKEQEEWLKDNIEGTTTKELVRRFREKFDIPITERKLITYKNLRHLTNGLRKKFTDEQKEWVKENYKGVSNKELTEMFNKKYGTNFNQQQIQSLKAKYKLDSGLWHKFSEEQNQWIIDNCKDSTYDQLTEEFNKKFETNLTKKRMVNKVIKLNRAKDVLRTWAPKGAEKLRPDGYIYIKVANDEWVPKHRYIYEQHYGKIPEDCVVMFLDGDKTNFELDNLRLVERKKQLLASSRNLLTDDKEINETALLIAELTIESKKIRDKMENKNGRRKTKRKK